MDDRLSYELFQVKLFSSGLKLRQRRERVWNLLAGANHWYETASLGDGDGAEISAWGGLTSNVQLTTSGARPVLALDQTAPTLLTFGAGRSLNALIPSNSGAITVFCVGYTNAPGSTFFELGGNAGGSGVSLYTESGPNLVARTLNTSGTAHFAVKNSPSLGVLQLYTIQSSTGANGLKLWINGTLAAQANVSGTLAGRSRLTVGADAAGNNNLSGGLALVLALPGVVSDANRQLIESKILSGYGLALG